MGRRKRSSPLDDLLELARMLPWWVGVLLAVGAYFGLHMIAVAPLPAATQGNTSALTGRALWKSLAIALQYIVPLILLAGAAASAIKGLKRAKGASESGSLASATPSNSVRQAMASKAAEGEDLYEIWKGSPGAAAPSAEKWSLELLRAIDWKRFEEVCAEYFRVCGFHATTNSHGPDGGIDVMLYAPGDHSKLVNVVQCKQWKKAVGPKALRELLGVMTDMKVTRGIFVTSSTFNDEARRIATENRIHLLEGPEFLQRILERSAEDQQRLLKVATKGDYLTPTCPSCGIKLLKRQNKNDKTSFWGCANYPRCRYTLNAAA